MRPMPRIISHEQLLQIVEPRNKMYANLHGILRLRRPDAGKLLKIVEANLPDPLENQLNLIIRLR